MEKLRTLDLFSGIGGFSLGLDSTGYFETVAFCEIEAFPCKVLNKHWPDVPIYNDVKELSYEKLQADGIISRRRGIDVICGGYPCQPFSVAGRQGGEDDPRHLWPEYFRLIRELRPHYAIGENVGGHLRLGLDTVLEDLDSENYTVRCFSVEAASLGAPHRRERIFWIADGNPNGNNVDQKQKIQERASAKSHGTCDDGTAKNMANRHPGFGELTDEEIQAGRYAFNGSGSAPMGNTERDGSSASKIGRSNLETPEGTPQGKDKALESEGTSGSGNNEPLPDTQFKGLEGRSRDNCGGGREVLSGIEHDGQSVRRQARRTGGEDGGTTNDVSNTDSKRRGGRDLSGRGAEQRELLKTEQEGRTLGREAERCSELPGQEGEGATTDVADTDDSRDRTPRRGTNGNREKTIEGRQEQSQSEPSGHSTGNATDTHSEGLEGTEKARNSEEERTLAEQFTARQGAQRSEEERRETTFESYLGGGNDGISAWLDGSWERGIPRVAPSNKMRVPRLKALGNAVLPQLVYMVGMAIVLSTKRSENEE